MKDMGGAIRASMPSCSVPNGSKQSSGETIHARDSKDNIENLKNMPTVHTGGGKGSTAGVGDKGSIGTGPVTTLG